MNDVSAVNQPQPSEFIEAARAVLEIEAQSIAALARHLSVEFDQACRLILECRGRVITLGIGKSGHVAGKIASTFASTGTPAFFVHPGEASHGDLGMITPGDLTLAISNSGETPEILTILPIIKRMGVMLIVLTGDCKSTLGQQADACLNTGVDKEACPNNLAPTASTTAALAMGDALAVALCQHRGFSATDFARSHPGGVLGRRMLLFAEDIMHRGLEIPLVGAGDSLTDALLVMSEKRLGMTGVLDAQQKLIGVFTDGDLRRALDKKIDVNRCLVHEVMTPDPVTVDTDTLAAEVVQLLHTKSINGVFVLSKEGRIVGAINMHDLLKAGVV